MNETEASSLRTLRETPRRARSSPLGPGGRDEAPRIVINVANLPELPQRQYRGSSKSRRIGLQNAFVSRLLPQLPRHGLGPIASGQDPSVVTKHD